MADPLASIVPILLPFNDDFPIPGTVANAGTGRGTFPRWGGAALSSTQKKYGSHSCYFNGTSAFLTGSYALTPPLTGDFCLEGWFRIEEAPTIGTGSASIKMFYNQRYDDSNRIYFGYMYWSGWASPRLRFSYANAGTHVDLDYATTLTLNQWYHIAVTREATTYRLFLDGVPVASNTSAVALPTLTNDHVIGYGWSSVFWFKGYVDDFRLTHGDKRYDAAGFTPPDAMEYSVLAPRMTFTDIQAKLGSMYLNVRTSRQIESMTGKPRDYYYGGGGQIVGTVKEKSTPDNLPLSRPVFLFVQKSNLAIKQTWSDAAGNYKFTYLDRSQKFYVVTFDYLEHYRAVIADNLTPEAMP